MPSLTSNLTASGYDMRPPAEQLTGRGLYGDSTTVSDTLRAGLGGFSITRATAAYVLDWESVWLPLDSGEAGFYGGRRVKNLFLNSDAPASWAKVDQSNQGTITDISATLPDGTTGTVKQHVHTSAASDLNTPFYSGQVVTAEFGQRRSLFASRLRLKVTAGTGTFGIVGRTNGTAIGSESNNPQLALTADNTWRIVAQTAQQFESHSGYMQTYGCTTSGDRTFQACQMQFEDVTGRITPIPNEYVPSTSAAGIRWFETQPSFTPSWSSPTFGTFNSSNLAIDTGGTLTEGATGTALDVKGVVIEPAATNLLNGNGTTAIIGHNVCDQVAEAVLDSASTNYSFTAPATANSVETYIDPRSMRLIYNASDITIGASAITSTTTDLTCGGRLRVGHSFWIHVAASGAQGPFVVSSFGGTTTLNFTGGTGSSVAGNKNLHRCPASTDFVALKRNNDSWHYSTVSAVTLPTTGAVAIDGYQHMSVRVTLVDALPNDGIHAGISGTNNNQPFFYWNTADIGITVTGGTGPAARIRDDWTALRAAGLGYLCRDGLVYELYGGTGATPTFDFTAAAGVTGRFMAVSMYAKRTAGSGTPFFVIQGYSSESGSVASESQITNASWARKQWMNRGAGTTPSASVGTGRTLRISVPANTTVQVILMQVEDTATNSDTPAPTSPIIVGSSTSGTTRNATRVSRSWAVSSTSGSRQAKAWMTNDFTVNLEFMPFVASLAQTQTLWSAYADSNNYASIDLTGTTLRLRKRVSGSNTDVSITVTPAAGVVMSIAATLSSRNGMALTDYVTSAVDAASTSGITSLSDSSTHEIGSLGGVSQFAFGAIRRRVAAAQLLANV